MFFLPIQVLPARDGGLINIPAESGMTFDCDFFLPKIPLPMPITQSDSMKLYSSNIKECMVLRLSSCGCGTLVPSTRNCRSTQRNRPNSHGIFAYFLERYIKAHPQFFLRFSITMSLSSAFVCILGLYIFAYIRREKSKVYFSSFSTKLVSLTRGT